jgi:excisionase family DNA binding protein
MSALKPSARPGLRPPTDEESRMARETNRKLGPMMANLVGKDGDPALPAADIVVQVRGQPAGEKLEIPLAALRLMTMILAEMGRGNAVTLTPVHAELTTHQAARFLNVSRPYLIKQLESGRLPYHKVGTHRRIALRDLLEYQERSNAERDSALKELARMTQELGEDD